MDQVFVAHVEQLRPQLDRLIASAPITYKRLPVTPPLAAVYLFSEGDQHLYVGRTRNLRRRLRDHCGIGATHHTASFAFLLAREATDEYSGTTRKDLMKQDHFIIAFNYALERISKMGLRYVEEADPTRQALLEIYVSLALKAKYNDFDTH